MKKAIYAGSFDPVTFGHIDILKKALSLFDEIYVLVAHNPSKKHLLSLENRIELVKSAIGSEDRVKVIALPYGETVAHKALELEVGFLVRGLRGHTDLDGEMVNARMNKEINHSLETVIFVTEINLEELSSSLVRGMIGLRDWKRILKNKVPGSVVDKLEERYFQDLTGFDDDAWNYLKSKLNRPYHNYNHKTENLIKRVKDLIMATDHSKQLTEEQLNDNTICKFVAADLMILACDEKRYKEYTQSIREEYSDITDDKFAEGRADFLKKMLKRNRIFPGHQYAKEELAARDNMQKEMLYLKGYTI